MILTIVELFITIAEDFFFHSPVITNLIGYILPTGKEPSPPTKLRQLQIGKRNKIIYIILQLLITCS